MVQMLDGGGRRARARRVSCRRYWGTSTPELPFCRPALSMLPALNPGRTPGAPLAGSAARAPPAGAPGGSSPVGGAELQQVFVAHALPADAERAERHEYARQAAVPGGGARAQGGQGAVSGLGRLQPAARRALERGACLCSCGRPQDAAWSEALLYGARPGDGRGRASL
jgi:hypothetical protein